MGALRSGPPCFEIGGPHEPRPRGELADHLLSRGGRGHHLQTRWVRAVRTDGTLNLGHLGQLAWAAQIGEGSIVSSLTSRYASAASWLSWFLQSLPPRKFLVASAMRHSAPLPLSATAVLALVVCAHAAAVNRSTWETEAQISDPVVECQAYDYPPVDGACSSHTFPFSARVAFADCCESLCLLSAAVSCFRAGPGLADIASGRTPRWRLPCWSDAYNCSLSNGHTQIDSYPAIWEAASLSFE